MFICNKQRTTSCLFSLRFNNSATVGKIKTFQSPLSLQDHLHIIFPPKTFFFSVMKVCLEVLPLLDASLLVSIELKKEVAYRPGAPIH